MNVDQWLEKVKGSSYLLEDELKQLCKYVSDEDELKQVMRLGFSGDASVMVHMGSVNDGDAWTRMCG